MILLTRLLTAIGFSAIVWNLESKSADIYKRLNTEESDDETRDAQFAFQTTDLEFTKKPFSSLLSQTADETTDRTFIMRRLKHWAVVIHFSKGEKTLEKIYKFEGGRDDKGFLGYNCFKNVDYNEFDQAIKLGNVTTSPRKLLEIAEEISSQGKSLYNLWENNCQTWTEAFLKKISPDLYKSFEEKLYEETRSRIPDLVNQQFFDRMFKK